MQKLTSLLLALAATQTSARPSPLAKRAASDASTLPATFNAIAFDRTGWAVTASTGSNAPAIIDNNAGSAWSSPGNTASITLDMKTSSVVAGLSYLPAASGGNIGPHTVEISKDGNTWVLVARGTYLDDNTLKKTFWAPHPARYVRLTSTKPAAVTAAEVHILGMFDYVPRQGWKITADSAEASNPANNAIDDSLDSFWHTQFSGTPPNYPHTFTIDQGTGVGAIGLSYHPRADNVNGRIGGYSVESSDDGQNWKQVVKGTWSDDGTAKMAKFGNAVTARFFRLNALTEAGGRGPWASAAEINLLSDAAEYKETSPADVGVWGPTVDFPTIPVAAAVVPGNKVVTWSSYSPIEFTSTKGFTLTSTLDMSDNSVTERQVDNTHHDMFCPGISLDGKGRPVVTGGNTAPKTSIFDGNGWVSGADMHLGRGYQASATTSQGKVFTVGGSWNGGVAGNRTGEIYDPNTNTWTLLSGCPSDPMMTKDARGPYRADNHAWLFGWKDGMVFHAGPSQNMNWYSTTGPNGSQKPAGKRGNDNDAMNGNAIMFDASAGKILAVNGGVNYDYAYATNNANVLSIGEDGTVSTESAGPTKYKRAFANSVVLPDGQVFTNGGQTFSSAFTDDNSTLVPEMFDPDTKGFKEMAGMIMPRTYHSFALLLPDATVLCGGGGLCGAACATNHFDANIFNPPYLFKEDGSRASRPTILSLSGSNLKPGSTIVVATDRLIKSFSMVRAGSATHSTNTDQRRVPLVPTISAGLVYTLRIPDDAGIALPGFWMLFAMDGSGVPSVAKEIMVGV